MDPSSKKLRMGRVDAPSASPHQQEIHQMTATGDAPPAPDEDLSVPPADFQPPPPHTLPPQDFPPAHGNLFNLSASVSTAGTAFPPPQDQSARPFPPTQPPQNLNFQPQQMNAPPQRIRGPSFASPTPSTQHNLLQINKPWSSHLFECMSNPQNAIVTLFFPCVTFGQIAEILDNGGTSCARSGLVYSCVAFCLMPCLMSCGYRSKLRAKLGLAESPAPDCLIHFFCECCALCQEYRELEKRGFDPSIGHAGNVARHQQLQQLGMMPPMQQSMMI